MSSQLYGDQWNAERKAFLQAEKSIKQYDEKAVKMALQELDHYPLVPYLHYQFLLKKISVKTIKEKDIQAFLIKYPQFPLKNPLIRKWIGYLTKEKRSNKIIQYAPDETDRTEVLCASLYAKYDLSKDPVILKQVKKLWLVGHSQPKSCDPLFEQWQAKGFLTSDLIWQRFNLALENHSYRLANYLLKRLDGKREKVGKTAIIVAKKPEKLEQIKPKNHPYYAMLYTTALTKLAYRDPELTEKLWDKAQRTITFTSAQKDRVHHQLGISLAHKHRKKAIYWLKKVDDKNTLAKHWQIRLSLRNQQWREAIQAIDSLDKNEKQSTQWRYWLARALEHSQQEKVAHEIFAEVAQERDYYGFLSANKINVPITLKNYPIRIAEKDIKSFSQHSGVIRIQEWHKLNRTWMERIEWRYLLRDESELNKLAAAKYAHDKGWLALGILANSMAEFKNDLPIRFPFAHKNIIQRHAKENKLESDWVFALTRQESAFHTGAVSSAGARGLMQLMPTTAEYVANLNQVKLSSKWALHQPDVNVRLGTLYLQQLMNRFYQHPVLATASYNAGPSRIQRWLPRNTMDADIWIESMPYQETRDYVKNIVTYSQIYRALDGKEANISQFMKPVPKRG